MARGIALSVLVQQLRHETGRAITVGAGTDEKARLEHLLRRTQEFWYDEYAWPHMQAERTITTVQNQRFYAFPSDMNVEEVQSLFVKEGGRYPAVVRGISIADSRAQNAIQAASAVGSIDITAGTSNPGTNKVNTITVNGEDVLGAAVDWVTSNAVTATAVALQINTNTSSPNYGATAFGATITITADIIQGDTPNTFVVSSTVGGDVTTGSAVAMAGGVDAAQANPVQKWDILEETDFKGTATIKIEVWPIPAAADTLYLVGKRSLSALIADSDTADLDDQLIVRTAAAELTARENKRDSESHSAAAQARFVRLKSRMKAGTVPFSMLGVVPGTPDTTVVIRGTVEV